jgi:hypothetical protein
MGSRLLRAYSRQTARAAGRAVPWLGGAAGALACLPACGGGASNEAEAGPCLAAPGRICTIAGDGTAGDGADGLPALMTHLYLPQDVTVGPDGRPTIVDWNNHRVRALQSDGTLRIVAGVGDFALAPVDILVERLNHPTNVAFDSAGHLAIAAWHNNQIKLVLDPDTAAMVDTCGDGQPGFRGDGGPAAAAALNLPVAVVYDAAGDLIISDQANARLRRIDHATGIIDTIAGAGPCATGVPCSSGDGGSALAARFALSALPTAQPGGRIDIDAQGNIYLAETGSDGAGFKVRKIGADGMVTTVAGSGVAGAGGDGGPATSATLAGPSDVAVAPDGSLYIADLPSSCVRVVHPDGTIATYAGHCGAAGFAGDGGAAPAARLDHPGGIGLDGDGNLYVADTRNNRIRIVYR